jgi:hypothetical protein
MPKVTTKIVDVVVVMEMNLAEARVLRRVLGETSEADSYPLFDVLNDALNALPEILVAGVEE